jgi:hypothetical protein
MLQNGIRNIQNRGGQWLAPLALSLFCAVHLFGQGTAGSITGVVQDAQGAVVVGAKVTAFNQNEKAVTSVVNTNGSGVYVFSPLPVASYTITVEAQGFKSYSQKDIVLNVNDNLGLPPVALTVGAVSESISVEANAVALETVTATRSAVVDNTQINELPVATRTNVASAYLREIPGSSPDASSNFNGQRSSDAVNQLDGVTMMDAGNNGVNYSYSIEAVGEVKVSTNAFTAEFGRSSGYQVSSVLKSGTSDIHGSGFWFHKNEGLNANSSMNNMTLPTPIQKPLSRDMLSGFTVGGPVWMPFGPLKKLGRQKLFWFTSFEFHPSKSNTVVTLEVPTLAEANGDFTGLTDNTGKPVILHGNGINNNIISPSLINQYGKALLTLINTQDPVNVTGNPLYNHLSTLPILPSRIWDDIYKIDYNISQKHRIAGHLLRYHNSNNSYGGLNTIGNVDWSLYNRPDGEYSIAINFVSVLSPTMTNEFNYGRSYNYLPTSIPTGNSPYLKVNAPGWGNVPVLNPGADPSGFLPGFNFSPAGSNISNGPSFSTQGLPYINRNPISNYSDNLSKLWGTHTLKAGAFIEWATKYQTATADTNGTYNFTNDSANPGDTGYGFSNALLGNFDTYSQASHFFNGAYNYRNYEWYIQDSWKMRSNLTINYGLRMELIPPWFEGKNQVSGFFPDLFNPAQEVALYQPYCSNGATSCSGATRIARNPITGATLPFPALIGTEVPGIGNRFNGAVQAGTGNVPAGMINSRGVQWAPRLGFSWSPFGKTVVRGGGGVSYSRVSGQGIFNELSNPPNLVEASLYYGNVNDLNGSTPLQAVGQSTGLSRDGHIPTVYSFNFGIQRELPWKGLLDVSYVGTIGNHLVTFNPFNNTAPGSAWLPQNQDPTLAATSGTVLGANALNPNFYRQYLGYAGAVPLAQNNTNGSLVGYGSNENYNGLQVSYKKRMSNGLQFGTNYTWSKALGTMSQEFNNGGATPFGNPVSSVNVRAVNYGPLSYDRRHALNIDIVYNLPSAAIKHTFLDNPVGKGLLSGWQLSAIGGYSSGAPQFAFFTIAGVSQTVQNQEYTGSADIQPRATLICNPTDSGPKTQTQYINTSCLQPGLRGSIGADSGSGAFRGLGYRNWDASIMKRFQLGSEAKRAMQIRFETYNTFNHPEWSGINLAPTFNASTGAITNLANPVTNQFGYGALNGIRAARTVQLGARFTF